MGETPGRGGPDRLRGGSGHDCLIGGAGDHRLPSARGSIDIVACGKGRDVARVGGRDRVSGCERIRRG